MIDLSAASLWSHFCSLEMNLCVLLSETYVKSPLSYFMIVTERLHYYQDTDKPSGRLCIGVITNGLMEEEVYFCYAEFMTRILTLISVDPSAVAASCWEIALSQNPQRMIPWTFGWLKYSRKISSYPCARRSISSCRTSNSVMKRGISASDRTSSLFWRDEQAHQI